MSQTWEQSLVNAQVNVNRSVWAMNEDDDYNDFGYPKKMTRHEYILEQINEGIHELMDAKTMLENRKQLGLEFDV